MFSGSCGHNVPSGIGVYSLLCAFGVFKAYTFVAFFVFLSFGDLSVLKGFIVSGDL